ncbi:MAG: hypothetical protein LBN05_07085 [Oscillospiraceae bacterium]|jgi:DNA repair protein RadC|nr:hypothetical protein [Oscillospiraceae bacterium]
MPENIHENHRARLRYRFRKEGLGHFAPHQVLELLLFYAVPRRDTNPLAHTLLAQFGSLRAVLDAPIESLMRVPGISENAAIFLSLLPQVSRGYALGGVAEKPNLRDAQILRETLTSRYVGVKEELPLLLCLDSAGRLKDVREFVGGSFGSAGLDMRTVVEHVLRVGASAVILAHNHPGGLALPSPEDVEATRRLAHLLRELRVHLLDHIVIAADAQLSMAADSRWAGLFI